MEDDTENVVTHFTFSSCWNPQKRFEADKRVSKLVTAAKDSKTSYTLDPLYSKNLPPRSSEELYGAEAVSVGSALVGRSANLEKPYLRLTTFADPNNVRPLPVLVKALAHIKSRYLAEEDFEWANEQLKSLRQDLTVQRIRNSFVLEGTY